MGGLQCAKQILDQTQALQQAMGCMGNSILLWPDTQPTQEMADEFQEACNGVAVVAAKIQRHVRGSDVRQALDAVAPTGG